VSDPTQSDPSIQEVQQLLLNQQAQIGELTARLAQLAEIMTSGHMSQTAVVGPGHPAPEAEQSQLLVPEGFESDSYFVRIKPYNKQRGHVRRNQFFAELGRLLKGGTGQPGSIPEWAGPVDRNTAISLAKYRQRPYDPYSEPVCDIVTAEEKVGIDRSESQYRAATLGLAGVTPQQIIDQLGPGSSQLNARTTSAAPRRSRPSTLHGAQAYQQLQGATQPPAAGMAKVQRIAPPAMSGRAAALANLTVPPPPPAPQKAAPAPAALPAPVAALALPVPDLSDLPPPPPTTERVLARASADRGVSEDLTREAKADVSAEAAISAVEKYVPSLNPGASRMRPKSGR